MKSWARSELNKKQEQNVQISLWIKVGETILKISVLGGQGLLIDFGISRESDRGFDVLI